MADRRSSRETQVFGYSTLNSSFASSLLDAIYRSIDEEIDQAYFDGEKSSSDPVTAADRFRKNSMMIEEKMREKIISAIQDLRTNKKRDVFNPDSSDEKLKPVRTAAEINRRDRGGYEFKGKEKKSKKPLSPGGKLVAILNSLLLRNQKKAKINAYTERRDPSPASAVERSVRFSPATQIEKVAQANFKNSNKPGECDAMNKFQIQGVKEFSDEDDDDAASCSSADLFELENLLPVGTDTELPVCKKTIFLPADEGDTSCDLDVKT